MDDEIRQRRAHQFATSYSPEQDDPSTVDEPESASAKIDFGHVGQQEYIDNDRLDSLDTASAVGNTSETEDQSMQRKFERPRSQYSFVPPKESIKEEIKRPTSTTAEEDFELPGSFPNFKEPREETKHSNSKSEHTFNPTSTDSKPTTPSSPPNDSEKTCRICFSPATPDDRLISPCKCRGTSKWIHLSCLTTWRLHSENNKSFYQCDQCGYRYSFRRTQFAQLVGSRGTLLCLTLLSFGVSSFIGGFLVKALLFLLSDTLLLNNSYNNQDNASWFSTSYFFYSPLDAGTDILSAASKLIPSIPMTWRDVFLVDVWHFIQGLISLGIIGVLGVVGSSGFFTIRTLGRTGRVGGRRRRGEGLGLGDFVFIAVIVLGCGKVGVGMWKTVKGLVKRRLARLGEKILEVDPDQA